MADQFDNIRGEGPVSGLFNSPDYEPDGLALALSGGGYKAAAFHLGALIRLEELGLLARLARVSSVSGGSIAAGLLGLRWKTLGFDAATGRAANFQAGFVQPLRAFLTSVNIDIPQILLGLVLPFESSADRLAGAYADHLYGKATLQDLPKDGEGPRFVLVATNYELNSLWRFSQKYAADYRVGMIDLPTFPLARIVAASSGFPPFFCPLTLDFGAAPPKPAPGADRNSGRFLQRALLCDGGVYDNMGLEPIWKRYGTLLVSNAGDLIEETRLPGEWFSLLERILGMIHRQAENNRQRMLMILANSGQRKVAYWPLRNTLDKYPTHTAYAPTPGQVTGAQKEAVRLWSLSPDAFARLANHGYTLCDAAVRSYLDTAAPAPTGMPF